MKRSLMLTIVVSLFAAFATAMLVAPVLAREDIEQMIATAKTAADHEAIAGYYDRQAQVAKEKAGLHRRMLAIVKKQGGPGVAKWHMDDHCAALVKEFEQSATNYSRLATAHRELAKELK
jgi:hypothetical protein